MGPMAPSIRMLLAAPLDWQPVTQLFGGKLLQKTRYEKDLDIPVQRYETVFDAACKINPYLWGISVSDL